MTAWISRVKTMAFDLEDARGTVTEEHQIILLTMGLDDSYGHLVANIDAMPTQDITIEYITT
jgi:hypothetical protein